MKYLLITILFLSSICKAQMQFDGGVALGFSSVKKANFAQSLYDPPNHNTIDSVYTSYNITKGGWGVYLFPKYQFANIAGHGLNVGIPFFIGFGGSEGDNTPIYYDANLTIDITGGRLNKMKDNTSKTFGYYLGAGIGIVYENGFSMRLPKSTSYTNPNLPNQIPVPFKGNKRDYLDINPLTTNFVIHAGLTIPFLFDKELFANDNMGIGLFYKFRLKQDDFSFTGINVYYAIGSKSKDR